MSAKEYLSVMVDFIQTVSLRSLLDVEYKSSVCLCIFRRRHMFLMCMYRSIHGFQVPVALVAPYVSLVAPLGANAVPKNAPEGLPKMDRLNMNFGRTFSDGRYDPVANCSWPRSGVRPGGLVTGLEPVVETVMARFSFKVC